MSAPVVNGVALALIPNTADIITSGDQYIDRRLLPGLLASATAFRAEAGKPVYVREAYRSDAEQLRIFLQRYYRTTDRTGVFYDGSYWKKKTGAATAAVPGSAAANHRLGLCLDLWSGIDTSFTSREHLIWVRVAKPHGWTNTGTGFGEPWHQQGIPGVSPAGSTPIPFPTQEEDDMFSDEDRKLLKNVETLLAGEGGSSIRAELRAAKATLDNVEDIVDDTRNVTKAVKDIVANVEYILAKEVYEKLSGGVRDAVRDARARLANLEFIIAKENGGGYRETIRKIAKKLGA